MVLVFRIPKMLFLDTVLIVYIEIPIMRDVDSVKTCSEPISHQNSSIFDRGRLFTVRASADRD